MRPKPDEEKKGRFSFSLGKDTHDALVKAAKKDGRNVSSMADRILREFLGLTDEETTEQ